MAGPWEDYQDTATTERPPWEEYGGASEPARKELPRGIKPSTTGAGRSGGMGGAQAADPSPLVVQADQIGTRASEDRGFTPEPARRRGGTLGDVKPYGAGDARINPPETRPLLERPYTPPPGPMTDENYAKLTAMSEKPAPPAPVGQMQAAPPESTTGTFLRKFDRKPLDQSLAAYPTEVAADAARGIAQVPGSLATSAYGALRAGADVVGADRFAEWAGKSAAAGQDYLKQLDNPNGDQMVTGALKSLGTTALGGAAGGSKTAISLIVGQTAADKYSQLRDAGVSIGEAMPDAVVHGYAEYLGERIGVPSLGRMVASVAAKSGARPMAVLKEALKQQGEEQVTTALQSLNDKFGSGQLKPGLTWDQYLDDAVQTAAQTAIMTAAAGGAGAAARGAAKAYDFARGNGFHVDPPLTTDPAKTQRAKTLDIFENIAAKYGMNEAAKARALEATKDMPLDDVGPFLSKLTAAYAKRGLVKPADQHAVDTLTAGPIAPPEEETPASQHDKSAVVMTSPRDVMTSPAAAPTDEAAALEQRLAQKFGIDDGTGLSETPTTSSDQRPVKPVAESQALAPSEPSDRAVARAQDGGAPNPIEGEPINRNWTAFSPESGTLNIPREQMPQISAEHRGALVNFLNARGVAHQQEEVSADSLKPTQAEFSPKKVQTAADFQGGDRSILVSSDNHILDGTHQWMAKRESGDPIKIIRLDAPIQDLLRLTHQFPSSTTAAGPKASPSPAAGVAAAAPAAQPTKAANETVDERRQQARGENGIAQEGSQGGQHGSGQVPNATANGRQNANAVAVAQAVHGRTEGVGGRQAQEGLTGKPATEGRLIGKVGRTPAAAVDVHLRPNKDGTLTPVHPGGEEMLNFETGKPIVLPAGISDLGAIGAIRTAGAISNKSRFFNVKGEDNAAAQVTKQASSQPEYQDRNVPRQAPEASGGDSAERAAEVTTTSATEIEQPSEKTLKVELLKRIGFLKALRECIFK